MKKNISYINRKTLLCILVIVIIIILVPTILATIPKLICCGFGSKVVFNDMDEGLPLDYCCPEIAFMDIGIDKNFYDRYDPVYLDMDADTIVSINDIRITPFAGFFPGSKVTRTEKDINAPLVTLANWSISFIDLNGDRIYSVQDPVYLHNKSRGNQIVSSDIRLTFSNGLLPGTRVMNSSSDAYLPALDLLGLTSYIREAVAIRFFNTNGNYIDGIPNYDRTDAVYLHIISSKKELEPSTVGLVGVNDLRLSL